MFWNYVFGFSAAILFPLLLGYPVAVWCGLARGLRALGFASACGICLLLIICRGAQMIAPIGAAKWPILALLIAFMLVAWSLNSTRTAAADVLRSNGCVLAGVLMVAFGVGLLLGVPILFGGAIQFDGTRNADSFTFTSSAQYMLGHAFYGAPDFTPEHPVYTISRGYFGAGAMQPRPAAEGYLAWLSALRGVDPMYLYNAVQAAGVMLAGLTSLAFVPLEWQSRKSRDWLLTTVYVLICPTLLHIAVNSNFANGFCLPAATAYVALGMVQRSYRAFLAGVLFIGCLLSGYPELLAFMAGTKGLCVLIEAIAARQPKKVFGEAGWMVAELAAAAVLLPWAALGALAVFRTTLGVSQAGASELVGNMFAGAPMFIGAALALTVSWRALKAATEGGRRWFLVGILVSFALAQGLMLARGFDYGGFKISEYFVTLMIAVALRSVLSGPAGIPLGRVAHVFAIALAIVMVAKSTSVLRRSWDWSKTRRVSADLIKAGRALASLSHGNPIALGETPQPFYYGMWVPYVASAPIAFDLKKDPDAAGYLSPYLRSSVRASELYDAARLQLDIDTDVHDVAPVVVTFGHVVIRLKETRSSMVH